MAGLEPAIFCLEGKRLIQLGHTGVKQRLYLTLPYLTLHYITVSLDHHGDTPTPSIGRHQNCSDPKSVRVFPFGQRRPASFVRKLRGPVEIKYTHTYFFFKFSIFLSTDAPTLFFQPELSLKTEFAGADWRWKHWKTLENVGNVGNVSTVHPGIALKHSE